MTGLRRLGPSGMDDTWADYIKALNLCCDAVKLTAYYTMKAAEYAEETAKLTMLNCYFVEGFIKYRQELPL